MVDVVGIGALNWDTLLLVDRFASPGEEIVVKDIREEAGGSAANTISALAKWGVECGFAGRVGMDREGELILEAFKNDGVDVTCIKRAKERSGVVLAFIDKIGERTMYVSPGVNKALTIMDLNSDLIGQARYVHMSSFGGESAMKAAMAVPALLDRNATFSFAPGFLTQRGLEYLKPLLLAAKILFLNEKEALNLTGKKSRDASLDLIRLGVEIVVITLGSRGCMVTGRDGVQMIEQKSVKAVDTTGAGDAFSAGFLYGNLKGYDVGDSARIGNYVASNCVKRVGARSGLPKLNELKVFLSRLNK